MSCSRGTTDGTVTASVVPKNWLAVAKNTLIQDQQHEVVARQQEADGQQHARDVRVDQ
jgi:hypothetical protein